MHRTVIIVNRVDVGHMSEQVWKIGSAVVACLAVLIVLEHFADVVPSVSGTMRILAVMTVAAFALYLTGSDSLV